MSAGDETLRAPISLDSAVETELIRLIFDSPSVPLINGFVIVVTAAAIRGAFPFWMLASWLVASLAVVLIRVMLWSRFNKRRVDDECVAQWGRRFTVATAVAGSLWGLTAIAALVVPDISKSVFAAFVVGGLSAGAAMRNSPHLPALYVFVGPAALPMIVVQFVRGESISIGMGAMLLAFTVVVVQVGRENHKRLADYIRIKIEQEVLNAELKKVTLDLTEQIAEKEKMALALEESSERFRAIGQNALDAIVISDCRGTVVYWNPAAERMLGYSAEEMMGRSVLQLLNPQDRKLGVTLYARFAETGTSEAVGRTLRMHALRKAGGELPVDVSISAMNLTGSLHVLGIVRDVSEQENTLAAIRRRESDIRTIAKLSDLLQSCRTMAEAYPIIADKGAALFPAAKGSLAMENAERRDFMQVTAWGATPSCSLRRFQEEDCPALRGDCEHESSGTAQLARCEHRSGPRGKPGVCLSLKVQGNMRAMVSLTITEGDVIEEATRQVLHSFADVLKLSLANLQLRESLAEQAFHDPLTGLFNRRYLMEILPREVRRAQRRGAPLTVAMLDIDHFKRFNDVYGHDAGDQVLGELAEQFTRALRAEDVACRYGGEEFLFLLPDCQLSMAYQRMAEISMKTQSMNTTYLGDPLPGITLSIGLAALNGTLSTSESLITAADKAMYAAKRMGRNRIECFAASPAEFNAPANP